MSPVGHSIIGLSLAALGTPRRVSKRRVGIIALSLVALANLPDWPIPGWGHDRYDISHSVFSILMVISTAWLIWIAGFREKIPGRLFCFASLAVLSHLLLDSFYNHGRGIGVLWPLSSGRLNFAMPWFETVDLGYSRLHPRNLKVFFIELIAYLPVLLLCLAWRWWTRPDLDE